MCKLLGKNKMFVRISNDDQSIRSLARNDDEQENFDDDLD